MRMMSVDTEAEQAHTDRMRYTIMRNTKPTRLGEPLPFRCQMDDVLDEFKRQKGGKS